jgi:ribosomal protein S4
MVVTFSGNVTVTGSPQAQVTSGTGCVGSAGVCTGNVSVSGNVVTVPLTTIADQQNINVRINGVNGAADTPATDFNIPMGVLAGDTNANRTVNAADVSQTKGQSGQPVTASNFRNDVNANGSINAGDINIVKADSGHSIP